MTEIKSFGWHFLLDFFAKKSDTLLRKNISERGIEKPSQIRKKAAHFNKSGRLFVLPLHTKNRIL